MLKRSVKLPNCTWPADGGESEKLSFTAYSVRKTRQMKKAGAQQTGAEEDTALED